MNDKFFLFAALWNGIATILLSINAFNPSLFKLFLFEGTSLENPLWIVFNLLLVFVVFIYGAGYYLIYHNKEKQLVFDSFSELT